MSIDGESREDQDEPQNRPDGDDCHSRPVPPSEVFSDTDATPQPTGASPGDGPILPPTPLPDDDPFDLAKARVGQEFGGTAPVKRLVTDVPVGKPTKAMSTLRTTGQDDGPVDQEPRAPDEGVGPPTSPCDPDRDGVDDVAPDAAAGNHVPLPTERFPAGDAINIGAGGSLIVPREDIDAEIDPGADLDLAALAAKKIRKPGRREWIVICPASELTARLLVHKPKADGIEVEHYYVAPALRGPIVEELKQVRVFVYYSFDTKAHALWVINVTPDNSWYESLHALFKHPPEFFASTTIRVLSDKDNARYRVKGKPVSSQVPPWPDKSTEQLLGEALGPERFILGADHPLYRALIEGEEVL